MNESISSTLKACILNESSSGQKHFKNFAEYFGEDLSGQTYNGDIILSNNPKFPDKKIIFDSIDSLEGMPEILNGSLHISRGVVKSLAGAPKIINGDFKLEECGGLTSFADSTIEEVTGKVTLIDVKGLTSLKSIPVSEHYDIRKCNITSFTGLPREVTVLKCVSNPIKSLVGMPDVTDDLTINGLQITSLEGCPERLHGNFCSVSNENLESLVGGPKFVGGDYICSFCSLVTMKGCAEKIGGKLECEGNKLISLEGIPEGYSPKKIDCRWNTASISELLSGLYGDSVIKPDRRQVRELYKSLEFCRRSADRLGQDEILSGITEIIDDFKSDHPDIDFDSYQGTAAAKTVSGLIDRLTNSKTAADRLGMRSVVSKLEKMIDDISK